VAKLNLTRVFDAGRVIQSLSKVGAGDLEDFITYLADFTNQIIGAIRKTLTIEDNLDSEIRTIDLRSGVSQSITLLNGKKVPKHVFITKTVPFDAPATSFGWQMAQDGTLQVKAIFLGSPSGNIATTLVILF
jgi:hypothetical protein